MYLAYLHTKTTTAVAVTPLTAHTSLPASVLAAASAHMTFPLASVSGTAGTATLYAAWGPAVSPFPWPSFATLFVAFAAILTATHASTSAAAFAVAL